MADHTITRGQQGAHEFDLKADEAVTVLVQDVSPYSSVQVISVNGDRPLYAALHPIGPKDPTAKVIAPGGFADLGIGGYSRGDVTIYVVSSGDATASVVR